MRICKSSGIEGYLRLAHFPSPLECLIFKDATMPMIK